MAGATVGGWLNLNWLAPLGMGGALVTIGAMGLYLDATNGL